MNYLKTASRTTEVDAVSDQIIALYHARPELTQDPFLVATMDTMKLQSEQITEAIKRLKVLNELDDRDGVRDRCVRALGHVLNGYANMPTEFARQHAPALKRVFDNYTMSIVSENYDAETSLIESLLRDLSDASLEPHIAALPGVFDAIKALREAQQDFATTQVEYLRELAQQKNLPSASSIKVALLRTINSKLIKYLDIMKEVDAAKYEAFATEVEKAVNEQNELVSLRHTLGEKKKGTTPTPPADSPIP
ncbi:DUF6261 family protein [Tannerella forsythia]|uniref:Uncharacterized protein n=1 Tax=Tannerella forsythia TaxID=28112 RepID=A0A3P1YWX6_TANFO|nr:DUF6261 family protein [Tannerella forsythia]RRD74560.1 hypothetical protein EII41_07860 [Tannerella forsythia]